MLLTQIVLLYPNNLEEQSQKKYDVIKHLILIKIQNIMDINADLLQWYVNFLIKNLVKIALNKKLAKELQKPIIRKFEKWKVHSPFIDNI